MQAYAGPDNLSTHQYLHGLTEDVRLASVELFVTFAQSPHISQDIDACHGRYTFCMAVESCCDRCTWSSCSESGSAGLDSGWICRNVSTGAASLEIAVAGVDRILQLFAKPMKGLRAGFTRATSCGPSVCHVQGNRAQYLRKHALQRSKQLGKRHVFAQSVSYLNRQLIKRPQHCRRIRLTIWQC